MSAKETSVTQLAGSQPDPTAQVDAAMTAAIRALERLDRSGVAVDELTEAREVFRQMTPKQAGSQPDTSDAAIANRVRQVLGEAEPDLCNYLLNGRCPDGAAQWALEDAEQLARMLGCAHAGAEIHMGGTPAEHVTSEWAYILERRIVLAKALGGI